MVEVDLFISTQRIKVLNADTQVRPTQMYLHLIYILLDFKLVSGRRGGKTWQAEKVHDDTHRRQHMILVNYRYYVCMCLYA